MLADPNSGDRINSYALVNYIPEPLAGFLNLLRQELVPNCFLRAHITVLPPRPITCSPAAASEELCSLVPQFEPFDVELASVEIFPVSDVIYVSAGAGADKLRKLHDVMDINGLKFREGFPYHPHVTLAQNLKPDELDELVRVARQRWTDFPHARRFRVETLTFVQSTLRKDWIDLNEYKLGQPEPVYSRLDRSRR